MEKELSILEAYKVMLVFLDNLYEMTKSDDLGGFLGGFQILVEDNKIETMDPAAWNDWINAVKEFKEVNLK